MGTQNSLKKTVVMYLRCLERSFPPVGAAEDVPASTLGTRRGRDQRQRQPQRQQLQKDTKVVFESRHGAAE